MKRAFVPVLVGLFVTACSSDPETTAGTGGSGTTTTGTTTSGAGVGGGPGGGGGGGAAPTGSITGLVKRYDYAFDLTTRHAKSQLAIDVAAPGGDCFQTSSELATVTNTTWNGAPAKSAAVTAKKLDACGEGVSAGKPLVITAEVDVPVKKTFAGLDVGFSTRKDLAGGDFTYLLSWVGGCDRFGPCDDDPSRLAAFHFDVTHPAGAVVLCPGTLTPGDTVTSCELSGTLAPTYSAFGFASDPLWKRSTFTTVAGIDVALFEVPGGEIGTTLDKASVDAYLTWITGLLGPFPYGKELRLAGGPTAWLGFEHPANIILQESLPSLAQAYADATMHVFMHETAHQWAGDRSTIATTSDFAWKEATAEYLAYVFEDEQRPPAEANASLAYWSSISLQSSYYPRPTDDPPPAVQDFYSDVYGPGPMVFYVQLESLLGRKAVLDGIKGFLSKAGALAVADLQKALEASSGLDLKPYFDAWAFGKGKPEWPTIAVTTAQTGNTVTVTVTQQNASKKLYGCKVEVEVLGATTSALATIDFGTAPKSDTATATVTLAEPVVGTQVEPRHRLVTRVAKAGVPAAPEPLLPVWPL
jgi:aminopeptidase N